MTNINKEIFVALEKIGVDKADALNVAEALAEMESNLNNKIKENFKDLHKENQSLKTKTAVLMVGYGFLIAILIRKLI